MKYIQEQKYFYVVVFAYLLLLTIEDTLWLSFQTEIRMFIMILKDLNIVQKLQFL